MKVFPQYGNGLKFTLELIKNSRLQFLDLCLSFEENHVCWQYLPRSRKPILPFSSRHSKVIKNGIAYSALKSALHKSCEHGIERSFLTQIQRLLQAGYPNCVLSSCSERLLRWVKGQNRSKKCDDKQRYDKVTVLPYVHKLTHGLSNVGNRYGVRTVFSAPNRFSAICPLVRKQIEQNDVNNEGCGTNHVKPTYVPCKCGVVYQIPLTCGNSYVGQTSRCLNVRLKEHNQSLNKSNVSHLASHCCTCGCLPVFSDTKVLSSHKCKITREVIEAFHIKRMGDACVSQPSLSLTEKEFDYLLGTCTVR